MQHTTFGQPHAARGTAMSDLVHKRGCDLFGSEHADRPYPGVCSCGASALKRAQGVARKQRKNEHRKQRKASGAEPLRREIAQRLKPMYSPAQYPEIERYVQTASWPDLAVGLARVAAHNMHALNQALSEIPPELCSTIVTQLQQLPAPELIHRRDVPPKETAEENHARA
mgnify:CR=1 FL=1